MDQEKIGKFIKELRLKHNLSQAEFADKLGVTFQAVSKWENGKNLPDMLMLKEISTVFKVDIDEILNGQKKHHEKNPKFLIIALCIIILVLLLIIAFLWGSVNNNVEFNRVNTTNDSFIVDGSVVHTKDRTMLMITKVIYKGQEDNTVYKKLNCSIYENRNGEPIKFSDCDAGENLTLKEFLEQLEIKMDHNSPDCTMFKDSEVYVMLNLEVNDSKTVSYKIPISITEEECN